MNRHLLLATVAALGTAAPAVAASIVGDSIEIWSEAQLSDTETYKDTVVVIDPGIEYTQSISSDIYHLDFGPSSIELNTLSAWFSPYFNTENDPSSMILRDIDVPGEPGLAIGAIDVDFTRGISVDDSAPDGYPEFSAENVTYTGDSVRIEYGGYRFAEGSRLTIGLEFVSREVPEPATAGLAGLGAIAAMVGRLRR